jgi:hypothetical protein
VTFTQAVAIAVGLFIITVLLGLLILVAFQREDRRQERRRAMDRGDHPSQQDKNPWDHDPDRDNL